MKTTLSKVLIVEDHPIFREGLKQVLAGATHVRLIGEADNARKALGLVRKERWDLVVLDIALPDRSGLELLKDLKHERPKLPVLILSALPEDQYALRMLKAGAAGYLTKEKAPEHLVMAVRKVLGGRKYVTDSVAEKLACNLQADTEEPLYETLSDREYEVLRLIASGKTVKEIAQILFLSVRTVSTYRARTLEKLGLKNNAELTRYALQNCLII